MSVHATHFTAAAEPFLNRNAIPPPDAGSEASKK